MKVDAFMKRSTGAFRLIERTTEALSKIHIGESLYHHTKYKERSLFLRAMTYIL